MTRAHVDMAGAAKESSAYACTLDPPRHLGDPMSVARPLATQDVPGETDSSFAASASIIGEAGCCYAPVLADLFTIPLRWAGLLRPIRENVPGGRGACKRPALDLTSGGDRLLTIIHCRSGVVEISGHVANSLSHFPRLRTSTCQSCIKIEPSRFDKIADVHALSYHYHRGGAAAGLL
jgi:hypothetical protein